MVFGLYLTMRKTYALIVGLFLSGLPGGLLGQTIVNTETLLAQVDSGWAATFGVGGDLSFGNSRVTDLSTDASFGHSRKSMTYRLAGSWGRLAEDGNVIQENRFAQLRVNRQLGNQGWQAFAFVQTASNSVLLMQERTLMGGGVRKRLADSDRGWFDLGWGPFSEREVYNAELADPAEQLWRSSVTVASEWQMREGLTWRNTVYVQSALSDFSDTRFFFESAANVALTERMSFEFDLIYRRDSQPHGGLEPVDIGTAFGLRWQVE